MRIENNKQNFTSINELKFEIEDAISRRDYISAELYQKNLENLINETKKQNFDNEKKDKTFELNKLIKNKKLEEEELKIFIINKAKDILKKVNNKKLQLNNSHHSQLLKLDSYFSNENFSFLRNNPEITSIKKAEYYYSHNHNFHMAFALKNQISEQTLDYIENNERKSNNTIKLRIESTLYQQEKEKEGLKLYLENEINKLKKKFII